MALKTVRLEAHRIMTSVAETLPTRMTRTTTFQSNIAPDTITDNILTNRPEKLPMVIAHVFSVFYTLRVNRVGSLQKHFGRNFLVTDGKAHGRVNKGHENSQDDNQDPQVPASDRRGYG